MNEARRFPAWSRFKRGAVLGLMLATVLVSLVSIGPLRDFSDGRSDSNTDSDLYRSVIVRVSDGQGFYSATVHEQRERGFPVRPAMTVREPTLTWFEAGIGGWRNAIYVLAGLALITGLAMIRRLEVVDSRRWFFALSGLAVLLALGPFVGPVQVTQHECWAGLLLVLSLCVRTSRHFLLALVIALVACLFRELAAPFLALMALVAFTERRHREAAAWVVTGVLFSGVYAAHIWAVGRETVAGDRQSPGWFAHGGLTHVLETVRLTTFAGAGPDILSVLVLVFGLVGWASITGTFSGRVFAWLAFWISVTAAVGRPENVVWGFMWTGPLVIGLALCPGALRDLILAKGTPRPISERE